MVLLHTIIDNTYKHFHKLNNLILEFNYEKSLVNFHKINNNKKQLILISDSRNNLPKLSTKFLNESVDYKFISRNFWNKFFNQYFQETIFISVANPLSENYINKLKNNGLSIYKGNDYKNFLIEFSKDLMNGKIQVLLKNNYNNKDNNDKFLIIKNNHKYIKYIWKKGINWHIHHLYSRYILLQNKMLKKNSWLYLKNIEINSLPIFTITNRYNKLIMAESTDQILLRKNFLQILNLNSWYNTIVLSNKYLKKIYTGLLFINPEDALEYKEYINYKNAMFQYDINLKLFIGQLKLYSRLLYSLAYDKEFRLVPDLKEVGDLVYKYQYNSNVIFDKNQKYGKNFFQGQPIYRIQPVLAKNINTNRKEAVAYFYNVNKNHKNLKYQAIFLNYKTAFIAWNKFKEEYSYYKLPKEPILYVSNLENFLTIYDNNHKSNNFIFIPSPTTYTFIKQYKQATHMTNFQYFINNQGLYIKSFFERLIWSLTSRQPLNL